jgi:hypothetical protein
MSMSVTTVRVQGVDYIALDELDRVLTWEAECCDEADKRPEGRAVRDFRNRMRKLGSHGPAPHRVQDAR